MANQYQNGQYNAENNAGNVDQPYNNMPDEAYSTRRDFFGENGMLATFFRLIFFPCNDLVRTVMETIFGKDALYNLIKLTWQDNGQPIFVLLTDDGHKCHPCNRKNDCCANLCCFFPWLAMIVALFFLCYVLEVIIGIFQLALGFTIMVFSIFPYIWYKISGLSPLKIGFLFIWRALTRITMLNVCCCWESNTKRYIEQQGKSVFTLKTWEDHVRTFKYLNVFSVKSFIFNVDSLSRDMLTFPIISVIPGVIHLAIGLVTIVPCFLISIFFRSQSISWLEWSCLHLMHGALGLSCIFSMIYFASYYESHITSIHKRLGIENMTNEQKQTYLMSNKMRITSVDEIRRFFVFVIDEFDPYEMDFLFREDGKMNWADWASVLPILGIYTGVLRLLTICTYPFTFCHTVCNERHNRPSYVKINSIYLLTGIFAIIPVTTWINYIIFANRELIIPNNLRKPRKVQNVLPIYQNINENAPINNVNNYPQQNPQYIANNGTFANMGNAVPEIRAEDVQGVGTGGFNNPRDSYAGTYVVTYKQ